MLPHCCCEVICVSVRRLMGYCEGNQNLYQQGTAFVKTIKELMQLLLEYRAVVQNNDTHDCMMCCTVNLLARL